MYHGSPARGQLHETGLEYPVTSNQGELPAAIMLPRDKGQLHITAVLHDEEGGRVTLDGRFKISNDLLSSFNSGRDREEEKLVRERVVAGLKPDDVMTVCLQAAEATDLFKGDINERLAGRGEDGGHVGGTGEFEDCLVLCCVDLLRDGDVVDRLCREEREGR